MMSKEIGNTDTAQTVKKTAPKVNAAKNTVVEKTSVLSNKKIYVGPGSPGLMPNTVYDGGYPLYVQEMIDDCPEIEKLMVNIDQYAVSQKSVKENGSLLNTYAKKVTKYFQGEASE